MKYSSVVAILFLALLGGCSSFEILNAMVPKSGYIRTSNIAYGNLPQQRLDVYKPKNLKSPADIVIFIHGGYWSFGNKDEYLFVGEALTTRGFVAVLPDFRLYPNVTFPGFVQDAAKAVRWVHDHAAEIGGDPKHIYLMGHSSGAYVVALLTLDNQYLKAVGLDRSDIAATAAMSGPYILVFGPRTGPIFNVKSTTQPFDPRMEPINCVDGHEPPILLQHGTWDTTVSDKSSIQLADRIRQKGGQVKLILYPAGTHMSIMLALSSPFRWLAPVLDDTADFFHKH
jgi:acetyl esterase/lipase